MFRISVEKSFSSAHFLRNYSGKCKAIHGHNWLIKVTMQSPALDESGMVLDFGVLKQELARVCGGFDHVLLNDVPPFDHLNPTAEQLAKFIFEELSKCLSNGERSISSVKIWETPTNVAEYRE